MLRLQPHHPRLAVVSSGAGTSRVACHSPPFHGGNASPPYVFSLSCGSFRKSRTFFYRNYAEYRRLLQIFTLFGHRLPQIQPEKRKQKSRSKVICILHVFFAAILRNGIGISNGIRRGAEHMRRDEERSAQPDATPSQESRWICQANPTGEAKKKQEQIYLHPACIFRGDSSKWNWHLQWDSNPCCRDENPMS